MIGNSHAVVKKKNNNTERSITSPLSPDSLNGNNLWKYRTISNKDMDADAVREQNISIPQEAFLFFCSHTHCLEINLGCVYQ